MRGLFTCLAILSVYFASGQKLLRKSLIGSDVTSIIIDAGNCFELNLETSDSDELQVYAQIEGEYSKDLVVNLETEGKSILVGTGFQPNFTIPNDKLSAHKSISILLDIKVPDYKEVVVYGTYANVNVRGEYHNLTVKLSDGDCRLYEVGEETNITTQKGNIWLTTTSGIVEAVSDYGKVFATKLPKGDKHYVLQSKEGNIYMNKTK